MIYHSTKDFDLKNIEIGDVPAYTHTLMVAPEHFSIEYEINPYMNAAGEKINHAKAFEQWLSLKETYVSLGYVVHTLEGVEKFPDMVFAANQSLPFWDIANQQKSVILSRMRHPERAGEVSYFRDFFKSQGCKIYELENGYFEGNGDLIPLPGKNIFFAGYGFRTSSENLENISRITNYHTLAFELKNPNFYHLDTCLSIIDQNTALYTPSAFTDAGIELLKKFFLNLIEISEPDAIKNFTCNSHCPNGKDLITEKSNSKLFPLLEKMGLKIHPIDTSEFIKAGGSVYCMKLMCY
ncbi:MAG: amidinotransferase [Bacteriovoracaceae bacterium]|nr:amidinotransferase [Bacteriovoracaceae bacterium]